MPIVQPGYEGFAALGDMLGGGPQQRAEAKRGQYLGEASDAAFKFNRAAEERAKAIIAGMQQSSREGLPAAVAGVYTDPKQAALNTAVLGSAATPNLRNLGDSQAPGYFALEAERQDALAKGDFKRMNAVTAVLGDKVYEPVRVVGGNALPSGVPLGSDDFEMVPLPQTLAQIEHTEATTRQGQQRTDAAVAKSRRPAAPRASRPTTASDEADILRQAREAIGRGAKKPAVQERLRQRGYSKLADRL